MCIRDRGHRERRGKHPHLRQLPRQESQRGAGGNQCPRQLFLPRRAGAELHHRPRLPPPACRHPMGRADGRADRADRHSLEQGLDHRGQHDPLLDLHGRFVGQVRRRLGQPRPIRRRLRRHDQPRTRQRVVQGKHRSSHRPPQPHFPLRAGGDRRLPGTDLLHGHGQHHPRHPRAAALRRRPGGGGRAPGPGVASCRSIRRRSMLCRSPASSPRPRTRTCRTS